MFQPIQPVRHIQRLHQNPGEIPPEVPNVPAPQPEIEPGNTPQPELPPPSQDPVAPDSPAGPEVMPGPAPQEVPPSPRMGASRRLH